MIADIGHAAISQHLAPFISVNRDDFGHPGSLWATVQNSY